MENINVVICADHNVLVGVHVTLLSLLANSKACHHNIYHIYDGVSSKEFADIIKTLEPYKGKFTYIPVHFENDLIGKRFPNLHGSKFMYSKIFIPDLVPENKVLYIDVDTVVSGDIRELYNTSLKGNVIGATGTIPIERALEKDFLLELGFQPNQLYFNSGVMLMNLRQWRDELVSDEIASFYNKYAERLRSHDQTILNFMFIDKYTLLDERWNIKMFNGINTEDLTKKKGIYHFFGKPKPYDLLGEYFNPHFSVFREYLAQTEIKNFRSYKDLNLSRLLHSFTIYKSYIKMILKR